MDFKIYEFWTRHLHEINMTLNVDNDDFLKVDMEDFGDNECSYLCLCQTIFFLNYVLCLFL